MQHLSAVKCPIHILLYVFISCSQAHASDVLLGVIDNLKSEPLQKHVLYHYTCSMFQPLFPWFIQVLLILLIITASSRVIRGAFK